MAMAPLTPPPLSVSLTSFTVGSLTPFSRIKTVRLKKLTQNTSNGENMNVKQLNEQSTMKVTWWSVVGAGGCGGDRLVTHIYTAVDCNLA